MQADPVGYEDQMNLYAYVHNDPLNYNDPTGEAGIFVCAVPTGPMQACGGAVIGIGKGLKWGVVGLAGLWTANEALNESADESGEAFETENPNTSNPITGEPGSCSECNNSKGERGQRRFYGDDGYPETDIDYDHSHGKGRENSGRPHAHDWSRPSDGSPPTHENRGPARPPTRRELRRRGS